MWFALWLALALVTLGGGFLLGRSVYRSGRRLADELSIASAQFSEAAARFETAQEQLAAAAEGSAILADPAELRQRVEELREARADRRATRAAHRQEVTSGWGLAEWLEQRQAARGG